MIDPSIGTPGRTIAINPATNRLSAPGTTHDAAGNVTAWSGNVYSYGPFNETWKTNSSGDEWIHLYDANDQRVWSFGVAGTGANRNRWTLRGFDDKVLREYTYARDTTTWTLDRELIHRGPGQLLAAVLPGGQQRHYHLDHLGSPRLVTDASGAKVAFHSYFPYGEEATPLGQDGTRNKFTGHERDLGNAGSQADDLDYMHARYHNPLVARFLSVDPARTSARSEIPQSWNRYSYAQANPLRYVDPDGRIVVEPTDKRLKRAFDQWRSTETGRSDYALLQQSSGTYTFARADKPLTPIEKMKVSRGQPVVRQAGGFTATRGPIEDGKVTWAPGGTIKVDFQTVDNSAEAPYNGEFGDAAIVGHEAGHAVQYEDDPAAFFALSYTEQEDFADSRRDSVVEELQNAKNKDRGK